MAASFLTTDHVAFAAAIGQFGGKYCATARQREALTDGGQLSNSPGAYGVGTSDPLWYPWVFNVWIIDTSFGL